MKTSFELDPVIMSYTEKMFSESVKLQRYFVALRIIRGPEIRLLNFGFSLWAVYRTNVDRLVRQYAIFVYF